MCLIDVGNAMRIITGKARNKKIITLEGEDVRPTTQRAKEGIFSAIQFKIPGSKVLDLFSGSGQMGLESLSRGARQACFVDINNDSIAVIKKNISNTGLNAGSRVIKDDVFHFLAGNSIMFDIIFIDPPYYKNLALKAVKKASKSLVEEGILVVETGKGEELPEEIGNMVLKKKYQYGNVLFWKYIQECKSNKEEDNANDDIPG
jgi:16S rRNA (guanine966-N2)-methyltransferase